MFQEVASYPEHEEASRYLAKQKKKTRTGIMTSSMGTAQHLRMIDAINMYLDVSNFHITSPLRLVLFEMKMTDGQAVWRTCFWSKRSQVYFPGRSSALLPTVH